MTCFRLLSIIHPVDGHFPSQRCGLAHISFYDSFKYKKYVGDTVRTGRKLLYFKIIQLFENINHNIYVFALKSLEKIIIFS